LTKTSGYDRFFAQAVGEVLGQDGLDRRWSEYPYTTDSGIMSYVFREALEREPTRKEIARAQDRYMALLDRHHEGCREVPGAAALIRQLREDPGDWRIGFATGNWLRPGRFKLEHGGIPHSSGELSTADHALTREGIIQHGLDRMVGEFGAFERVVYVGDARWDAEAAAALKIGFLGRVPDDRQDRRVYGTDCFVPDFNDRDLFFERLEEARVPDL
ncbi:MAG: hypothetical protein AAF514_16605, partial [Verrucomicrobiota bacterium]